MEKPKFDEYVNIIRKRAHYFSDKYHFDYDECEAEGFLIYVNSLESFDPSKSSFSTHLYIQLNRIADYIDQYNRKGTDELDEITERRIVSKYGNDKRSEFLLLAREKLSPEAFKLIEYLLSFKWSKPNCYYPTVSDMMKFMGKTRVMINRLLDECKIFWQSEGSFVFC